MIAKRRIGPHLLSQARTFRPQSVPSQRKFFRVFSEPVDLAAIRAQAEATLEVTERFHPGYTFHLRSETILGAKNEKSIRYYPPYITEAKKPANFNPDKVMVSDVDGIFTDGAAGHFLHHFNNDCGRYAAWAKTKLLWLYTTGRSDFATRNEMGARINAGLTRDEMRKNAQDFFDHVLMNREFNTIPVPDEEAPIDYPFFNEEAIANLVAKRQDGWTVILASGSLRSIWETAFAPANLGRYAKQFFNIDLPKEPLVDFVIGASPKFKADHFAVSEAEKPLTIGDGKRLLVDQLLTLWGVNRDTLEVYSDDVHADRFFLQLAKDGNRFAVNIPPADENLARAFGHRIIRLDGLDADLRTPDHHQAIKTYRETIIQEIAVALLRTSGPAKK